MGARGSVVLATGVLLLSGALRGAHGQRASAPLDEAVRHAVLQHMDSEAMYRRNVTKPWYWSVFQDDTVAPELARAIHARLPATASDTTAAGLRFLVHIHSRAVAGDSARVAVTWVDSYEQPCNWGHSWAVYEYRFLRTETGWLYIGRVFPGPLLASPAPPAPPGVSVTCRGRQLSSIR